MRSTGDERLDRALEELRRDIGLQPDCYGNTVISNQTASEMLACLGERETA